MADTATDMIGYVIDRPPTEKEALEMRWTQETLIDAFNMLKKQRVYLENRKQTHSAQEELDAVDARLRVSLLPRKALFPSI